MKIIFYFLIIFFLIFIIKWKYFKCLLIVIGALMYLNEATLLNNIRTRYFKDRIYVSIGYIN